MLWVLPTTVHLHVYYYKVLADFSNSCIAQSSRISCCEFQRMNGGDTATATGGPSRFEMASRLGVQTAVVLGGILILPLL